MTRDREISGLLLVRNISGTIAWIP